MTSKERILCAMRGGTPDCVPVQLGILSIAPIFSRSTFWDVYYHGKFDLRKLMVEMVEAFELDGYLYSGIAFKRTDNAPEARRDVIREDDEFIVVRTTWFTPGGELFEERTFPRTESPTTTRGLIKTREDFELFIEYMMPHPARCEWDDARLQQDKAMLGDRGAVAARALNLPGMHSLMGSFDGKLEAATYFMMDHPALVEEYRRRQDAMLRAHLEASLAAKPDYIEFSNSGMLTLSNPEWVRELALPSLKQATAMCRQAGIPSELHCCGKAWQVLEMCAAETELDSINPLQPPPMGDCDLAECKQRFGKRFCLKGNVGVTEPMLMGTPDEVEQDVLRCLHAAKTGGGYILFTEEGLGARTPFENIRRYVAVGRREGRYES
ncbi:MAG: hypothetical protein JXB13_12930 [Phycisphaerae bacterium]|nr:hypothetical protein [Phycisphaerae bacterium]